MECNRNLCCYCNKDRPGISKFPGYSEILWTLKLDSSLVLHFLLPFLQVIVTMIRLLKFSEFLFPSSVSSFVQMKSPLTIILIDDIKQHMPYGRCSVNVNSLSVFYVLYSSVNRGLVNRFQVWSQMKELEESINYVP